MNGWQFKVVQRHPSGNWSLSNINLDQQSRVHIYVKVLEVAKISEVPDPKMSNYFCRESIGYGKMHPAGNIEYGLCKAIHGEGAGVVILRVFSGESKGIGDPLVMGIIADDSEDGKPANPCGDCRDIMLDALGPELEIVSGPADGGIAVIAKLSDYLFDEFEDCSPTVGLECMTFDTLRMGWEIIYDGFSTQRVPPERRYFARINGKVGPYYGALYLIEDYYPIYPLQDAIRQATRVRDLSFESVLIVGQGTSDALADTPPHVMYQDRQHLAHLNLAQELLTDTEIDPPVYLVRCKKWSDGTNRVHRIWQTSVKEWLPFPFSPRNFGPEFVSGFTQYLKSRL